MKKRILMISSIVVALSLVRCGCPEAMEIYYEWDDFSIKNCVCRETTGGYWGIYPLDSDDTVFYQNYYGLSITMQYKELSRFININFSNNAYAFSPCPSDVYLPANKITDVKIFTLYDFDESHLKLSDMTNCFFPDSTFLAQEIKDLNGDFGYPEAQFWTPLKILPTLNKTLEFRVDISFEDGTVISKNTIPIRMKYLE